MASSFASSPPVADSAAAHHRDHGSSLTPDSDSPRDSIPSSPPSVHNNFHAHRQNHNSSKLPAFRFVDLKKDSLALPGLLHHQHIPPSPVSPDQVQQHDHQDRIQAAGKPENEKDGGSSAIINEPNTTPETTLDTPQPTHHTPKRQNQNNKSQISGSVSPDQQSSPSRRSRASTFQSPSRIPSASASALPSALIASPKRSLSLDSPTAVARVKKEPPIVDSVKSPTDSTTTIVAARPHHRRAFASNSSNGIESSSGPQSAPKTPRGQPVDLLEGGSPEDDSTKEWAQGQRELVLLKSAQRTVSDEKKTTTKRPPLSYKGPPSTTTSGKTVIPPIRSFRSSAERRSLVLDMNIKSPRYEGADNLDDSAHRDRTLRALEGRRDDDALQMTPPDSAVERENTAELFLKIGREDDSRRAADENKTSVDTQSAVTRIARTSHRRPLSAAIPSYQATSPPQVIRRLSDQQGTSRVGRARVDERFAGNLIRLADRGETRTRQADDTPRKYAGPPVKASPLTPRSATMHDSPQETTSAYNRRRPSITESATGLPSRMSSYKQSNLGYSHPRTYNSSPLVPKSIDYNKFDAHAGEGSAAVEGTDSSTSTAAAPSTVWDELDDLKSRINRLELTGKMPPSSNAAVSRISDDRPRTATTNATTMSGSPKRGSNTGGHQAEVGSTTSSQRDSQHPILHSALAKSKKLLSTEVYSAIEATANDALSLSSMMGTAGQPGPISSGASTIGGSGATLTDRQLRRKADSICRSLTELCLALSDEAVYNKGSPVQVETPQKETLQSPTLTRFPGMISQRRPSIPPSSDRNPVAQIASPRAMSKFEERRNNMLNSTPLPSPRFAAVPSTPAETSSGRRSSLLLSRTRRATTEEPEDGRQTSMLRTRRAGTEEPEDGRKSSLLRTRRAAEQDDDEPRFRAPSRAVTEVGTIRPPREYSQNPVPDSSNLGSSALPRRRLVSSTINTRLQTPTTPSSLSSRRYFDRGAGDREGNSVADKLAEERGQRSSTFNQALVNRTTSLHRPRNRDSLMINPSSTTQPSAYR